VPEGHTIHRHARLQTKALQGGPVRVTSPQGWAAVAAAELDGRALERIDAYGKHLLYRFEGAPALHVHLGLFGKYRTHKVPAPDPWGAVRMRFEGARNVVDLSGATASELIDPLSEEQLLARLGPDPLRAGADPEEAWEVLKRRRIPISALILDQRFIAGIGNAYRAEILFACGIDPMLQSNTLKRSEFDCMWETAVAMLRAGERSGRIVTVPASEAGGAPSRLRGRERVQVYRREHCRRCGSPVRMKEVAARKLFWCPVCQPRRRRKRS
jgi:endonuclease VIII